MRKWIIGVPAAAILGMAIVAAAPPQKKDSSVTIRGCVKAGEEPDTFLLMRVTQVRAGQVRAESVPNDSEGRDVMYWLSSTQGLAGQIGQRVEVKGTVDLNDPKGGQTKVSEDSSKRLDATSEMKSDGKTVTVKTDSQPAVAPTTTSGEKVKIEGPKIERVVYRLKVASLRRIDGVCQ